jgi:dienelactone hydrolase
MPTVARRACSRSPTTCGAPATSCTYRTSTTGARSTAWTTASRTPTRGAAAAQGLPSGLVLAGFSLGVLPAQMLAQTRPGARGALLMHGCVDPSEFGGPWPQDVPVQIHAMDRDPWFVDGGDIDAASALVASAPRAELFLYPGDGHLFADTGLATFDAGAAALLRQRVLAFLESR